MVNSRIEGIRIEGVATAVPRNTRTPQDEHALLGAERAAKISESVGVEVRHVVSSAVCTSDLCFAAAEKLLAEAGCPAAEISGLIFISQTPDYVLPATSQSLHRRLGLPVSCFTFDVNLGCSGYVYGLWMAASLIRSTPGKVLLLVGDTISRVCSPEDPSVSLVFGDAGSATLLAPDPAASAMIFALGTDGSGEEHLKIPAGGFRQPRNGRTAERSEREGGNIRSDEDLFMDGPEVFTFTLSKVPKLVKALLEASGAAPEEIHAFLFHQANRFMLNHLIKRMKLPAERVPLIMGRFGNTSSASIPLALTASPLRAELGEASRKLLLAGFGVGFSWAGAVLECGGQGVFPDLLEIDA